VRRRSRAVLLLALAGLAWSGGLGAFISRMPYEEADETRPTDGAVVLTGGRQRLERGLHLLAAGRVKRLLVSGVHPNVDAAELQRLFPSHASLIECCVDLDHAALDTTQNATETAAWMRRHGFGSLRVVTADYHMPRSLIELRREMPEAELVPNPVFPEKTLGLLLGEYHKWLASLGRSVVA
jgi:uncharacterized SAM-binding protein YcdF (DUF218 family)